MERLSARDLIMLWQDDVWPQDIGALAVLDGRTLIDSDARFRAEVARTAIEGHLHRVPRLRQLLYVPRRGLGRPLWVDAPAFDLDDHVHVRPLPAPGEDEQLLAVTEQLRRRRLDRSRPLWEMWFLPGMPDGRVGAFLRVHHAIADGIAGIAVLGALLDGVADPAAPPGRPRTPAPPPPARELFADNVRSWFGAVGAAVLAATQPVTAMRRARARRPAMRELLGGERAPLTGLNRSVGQDRQLALIRSRLELVMEAAHAHGGTVNDILLAATAGGLTQLLRDRGEPVEDVTLPAYVPVSLRSDEHRSEAGNQVAQMVVPLPVGVSDPVRKLQLIAAETAARKQLTRPSVGAVSGNPLIWRVILKVVARKRVNVTVVNVPGPPTPLYLAGAQVLELFPLAPLVGNVTIGVVALSYAGQFNITIIADHDTVPDLSTLAASLRDELPAPADQAPPHRRLVLGTADQRL